MCLPLCFLKKIVQIEGWLIFIVSILAIVAAIYATLVEKALISSIHDIGYGEEIESLGISVAFWIFAGTIFLLSLSGICGAKKRNQCLLAIFNMGNICLFLAFFSLAIAAYVIGNKFTDYSPCNATQSPSSDIENAYAIANSLLCKDGCECYFTGDINNNNTNAVKKYSKTNSSLPIRAQECSNFPSDDSTLTATSNGFKWLENKLDCSGWCTPYPIQLFNDVNNNVKNYNNTCYAASYNYAKDLSVSFGNILISIASVMGLLVLLTCCLCFHPKNDKKTSDYYSRMAYYDE